jgi:hypothetical protein
MAWHGMAWQWQWEATPRAAHTGHKMLEQGALAHINGPVRSFEPGPPISDAASPLDHA